MRYGAFVSMSAQRLLLSSSVKILTPKKPDKDNIPVKKEYVSRITDDFLSQDHNKSQLRPQWSERL